MAMPAPARWSPRFPSARWEPSRSSTGRRRPAFPPAGHGTHTMVLVLAAGHDGRFDEVRDYANQRRESFAQPEINGPAGFELGDDSATLQRRRHHQPRAPDNLGGTLSSGCGPSPPLHQRQA